MGVKIWALSWLGCLLYIMRKIWRPSVVKGDYVDWHTCHLPLFALWLNWSLHRPFSLGLDGQVVDVAYLALDELLPSMNCKFSSFEEHHLSSLVGFVLRQDGQQDAVYSKGVGWLFALRADPLGNLGRGSEDNEVVKVEALVMSAEDAPCWQF